MLLIQAIIFCAAFSNTDMRVIRHPPRSCALNCFTASPCKLDDLGNLQKSQLLANTEGGAFASALGAGTHGIQG
jgi:hypothetical protein